MQLLILVKTPHNYRSLLAVVALMARKAYCIDQVSVIEPMITIQPEVFSP